MEENHLTSIVQVFPHFEDKIEYLFTTNANFRELCTDYIFCASKILDIKKEKKKYTSQIKEYEDVQRNLEQEILKMINL